MKKLLNYSFLFLLPFVSIMFLIDSQNQAADVKTKISNVSNIDLNKNYSKKPTFILQQFEDFYNKNSEVKKKLINAFMEEQISKKQISIEKNMQNWQKELTWEVIVNEYLNEKSSQQLEFDPKLKKKYVIFFQLATFLYDKTEVKEIVHAIEKELHRNKKEYKLIKFNLESIPNFIIFGNEFLSEYLPQIRSNIKKSNDNPLKKIIHNVTIFLIATTTLFLLVYIINKIVVWRWKDELDCTD